MRLEVHAAGYGSRTKRARVTFKARPRAQPECARRSAQVRQLVEQTAHDTTNHEFNLTLDFHWQNLVRKFSQLKF